MKRFTDKTGTKKKWMILAVIFISLFHQQITAQKVALWENYIDTGEEFRTQFSSAEDALQKSKKKHLELQSQGFITASIDSFSITDTAIFLYIFKGKQYTWKHLNVDSLPDQLNQQVQYFIKRNKKQGIQIDQIKKLTDFLLLYADDEGYPFAQVYYDEVVIDEQQNISARLRYESGEAYTIDSVIYHYEGELKPSFFLNYLDLHHGMKYSAKKLRTISSLVEALPYLEEEKDWELNFGVNKNKLHLYLKPKKTNQINAIVGIQPSASSEKGFDLTADVNLLIRNELGYGERLKFVYQQLQQQSPKMDVAVMWPYLLGTKFGIDASFEYQRFDTSFRKTKGDLGFWYHLSANNYLKLYTEIQGNRTITFDTNFVKAQNKLPPNIDVQNTGAGLNLMLSQLNNPLNPKKGWVVDISLLGAQRTILTNNAIDVLSENTGINYHTLYDTIDMQQFQLRLKTQASLFIPFRNIFSLKLAYENGYISGEQLFRNELYTIGGFKLLRGFNEQSIFSNHYHIGSIEPRVILGQLSYIYLFSDFGHVQTLDFNNDPSSFNVFSLGAGGTISTGSGIFNIAFGLGRQGKESLQLRNTRVHFGYAVYF